MWEKTRVDGSRKLKINAFPTIFDFAPRKKRRKPPKVRQTFSLRKDAIKMEEHEIQAEVSPLRVDLNDPLLLQSIKAEPITDAIKIEENEIQAEVSSDLNDPLLQHSIKSEPITDESLHNDHNWAALPTEFIKLEQPTDIPDGSF